MALVVHDGARPRIAAVDCLRTGDGSARGAFRVRASRVTTLSPPAAPADQFTGDAIIQVHVAARGSLAPSATSASPG